MRLRNLLAGCGFRAALLAGLASWPSHALYTREAITAYRVSDNAFKIDGRPDSLWRTIFAMPNGRRPISFQDYSKMVVLLPEKARNDDPANYVHNPAEGSATLMAAYDSKALYFFFLIKTTAYADAAALGCAFADLWRPDAADIYLDPSVWSPGSSDYRTFFYTDASGVIYGTSPRSIQVVRPISRHETRVFYRNRLLGDRFQVRDTLPAGLNVAVSPRTSADTGWVGVEMRIPFWTAPSDFAPGRSMFVSWGFNRYGDSARADCNQTPLIYRWAKNVLNYDLSDEKPPGWRAGDSTHYDPVRSFDGWGELRLADEQARNQCTVGEPKADFDTNWDAAYWSAACYIPPATGMKRPGFTGQGAAAGHGWFLPLSGDARGSRDARGRALGPKASLPFREAQAKP